MPATSAKVTFSEVSDISRARLLPKDMALPPPDCIWRMKKTHTPISTSIGNHDTSSVMYQGESASGLALITTFFCRSRGISSGSGGA